MFKWLDRLLTKKYKEIPLFWISFDLNKYKQNGVKNSCDLKLHPSLSNDKHIKNTLNDLVDYIREHYDMENLI